MRGELQSMPSVTGIHFGKSDLQPPRALPHLYQGGKSRSRGRRVMQERPNESCRMPIEG